MLCEMPVEAQRLKGGKRIRAAAEVELLRVIIQHSSSVVMLHHCNDMPSMKPPSLKYGALYCVAGSLGRAAGLADRQVNRQRRRYEPIIADGGAAGVLREADHVHQDLILLSRGEGPVLLCLPDDPPAVFAALARLIRALELVRLRRGHGEQICQRSLRCSVSRQVDRQEHGVPLMGPAALYCTGSAVSSRTHSPQLQ